MYFVRLIAAVLVAASLSCGAYAGQNSNVGNFLPTGGISYKLGYPQDVAKAGGATITASCGVAALTQAWKHGPLFDVLIGGNTYTIYGVGPGYPDVIRLSRLLAQSTIQIISQTPTQGITGALLTKCYDQSGNGKNFVGTSGTYPEIYLINGKVYIGTGGVLTRGGPGSMNPSQLIASSVTFNNRSFSFIAATNSYTTAQAGGAGSLDSSFGTLINSGSGATATNVILAAQGSFQSSLSNPPTGTGYATFGDYTSGFFNKIAPPPGIQPTVNSVVTTSSASTVRANGLSNAGAAPVAFSGSEQLIFLNDSQNEGPFSGRVQGFIASSTSWSSTLEANVRAAMAAWGNINLNVNLTNSLNVVIDGASTDQDRGGDPANAYNVTSGGGYGYAEIVKDQLAPYAIAWHNVAVNSQTIANCTTNYSSPSLFTPSTAFQSGSARNIIIGPNSAVSNTLAGNGDNGASAYTDFTNWVTAVKANGWTQIATLLFPPGGDAGLTTYNSMVKSNASSLGVTVIDMTANTQLLAGAPFANTDGHATVLGHQIIAAYVIAYLQQFL